MKKLLLAVSFIAFGICSAEAQTAAVAGGTSFNAANSIAASASHGLGFATSAGASVNSSQGAGVAVSTPLGGLSAGIGQSQGLTATRSASGGILGGGGTAAAGALSTGIGTGFGFTNH